MSKGLLKDLTEAQRIISSRAESDYAQGIESRLMYQVVCSDLPGVFSLGGDLANFVELIRAKNQTGLFDYAKTCVDILYQTATNYGLPFTTIALVQGNALGGGFEAALSSNIIIAERGAKFGFPETMFGMFPGMGAFSFLSRRLSPGLAKRIITSGKSYTAEELHNIGAIDILAEGGKGMEAVHAYINYHKPRSTGFHGLDHTIAQHMPISYANLIDDAKVWAYTAMNISGKNIKLMERLVSAQNKRWNKNLLFPN